MKVFILPSWYPPNGGTFIEDQARELTKKGIDVSVLAPKITSWAEPKKWFKSFLLGEKPVSEAGVTVIRQRVPRYPLSVHAMPKVSVYAFEKLFKQLCATSGKPDLLHAHSVMWGGYAAACIGEKYGIPYIIQEQRSRLNIPGEDVKPWMDPYFSKAYGNAAKVLMVGSLLRNGIGAYWPGVAAAEVLPNGVHTARFSMAVPPEDGRLHFIFTGTVDYRKGIDLLLDAIIRIKDKTGNMVFHIVGDGALRKSSEERAVAAGVADRIVFHGFLPHTQVAELMKQSHIFILPTRYEAQGVVFSEAMSCGLPIISSEGAPPEVCPPLAGVRVPVDDADALAAAILEVAVRYESFDREAIRQYAIDNFDFDAVAERLIALYRQALEQK